MQAIAGDSTRINIDKRFDRVIMGHFDAYQHLEKGIGLLRPDGILHVHAIMPTEEMHDQPHALIEGAIRQTTRRAEVLAVHEVKSYAPGIAHVVTDVLVS